MQTVVDTPPPKRSKRDSTEALSGDSLKKVKNAELKDAKAPRKKLEQAFDDADATQKEEPETAISNPAAKPSKKPLAKPKVKAKAAAAATAKCAATPAAPTHSDDDGPHSRTARSSSDPDKKDKKDKKAGKKDKDKNASKKKKPAKKKGKSKKSKKNQNKGKEEETEQEKAEKEREEETEQEKAEKERVKKIKQEANKARATEANPEMHASFTMLLQVIGNLSKLIRDTNGKMEDIAGLSKNMQTALKKDLNDCVAQLTTSWASLQSALDAGEEPFA
eukprot:s12115_g1.t1